MKASPTSLLRLGSLAVALGGCAGIVGVDFDGVRPYPGVDGGLPGVERAPVDGDEGPPPRLAPGGSPGSRDAAGPAANDASDARGPANASDASIGVAPTADASTAAVDASVDAGCPPGQCAAPLQEIMVVAMNGATRGNLGGLAAADAACAGEASTAGLRGTWQAMLCASSRSLATLFAGAPASLPVVNKTGQQLFTSWGAMWSPSCKPTPKWPNSASMLTFRGGAADGEAWLGCTCAGASSAGRDCAGWTSSNACPESGSSSNLQGREITPDGTACCSDATPTFLCVRVAM